MTVAELSPQTIHLRTTDVHLRDDDIILIRVKDDADIELIDAKETFEAVKKLAADKKKPVLVLTGSGGTITNEVKKFSASKEAGEPTLAEAVIANSLAHKLVVNFLIKFANMGRPMRLFTDESSAVEWLNSKRDEFNRLKLQ